MLLESDLGRTAWLSQGGTGLACSRAGGGALLGPDMDSTWRATDTERRRPGNEPRYWLGHWLQEGHHHKGKIVPTQDPNPTSQGPQNQQEPRMGAGGGEKDDRLGLDPSKREKNRSQVTLAPNAHTG